MNPVAEHVAAHPLHLVPLLRRNAVVFQVVFAFVWALRFAFVTGSPELPVVVAAGGAVAGRVAFRATRGMRARDEFRTPAGKRFLRPVTWLTVAQLVAGFALPALAGTVGADDWALPLLASTIGMFLVGFGRTLELRAVSGIGIAATVLPLCLPPLASGDALAALTAGSLVAALSASVWCCALAAAADDA
ncbi:MAG: hypothetical protein Q7V88_09920 [Actinomycetota bacterium]|nr:hypothetical protein [Actinomycetota bacterium]